jgi:hypothetical protein
MSSKIETLLATDTTITNLDIGKMTVTNGIKLLQPVADTYGLKLNRITDLRFARLLFVNMYRN